MPGDRTAEDLIREAVKAFQADATKLMRQHVEELNRLVADRVAHIIDAHVESALRAALERQLETALREALPGLLVTRVEDTAFSPAAARRVVRRERTPRSDDLPSDPAFNSWRPWRERVRERVPGSAWQYLIAVILAVVVLGSLVLWWMFSIVLTPPPEPPAATISRPAVPAAVAPTSRVEPPAATDEVGTFLSQLHQSSGTWPEQRYCPGLKSLVERLELRVREVSTSREAREIHKPVRTAIEAYRVRKPTDAALDRVLAIALVQVSALGGDEADGRLNWQRLAEPIGKTAPALQKYLNESFLPNRGVSAFDGQTPIERVAGHREADKDFPRLLLHLIRHIDLQACDRP
jgi:hypothetical protein